MKIVAICARIGAIAGKTIAIVAKIDAIDDAETSSTPNSQRNQEPGTRNSEPLEIADAREHVLSHGGAAVGDVVTVGGGVRLTPDTTCARGEGRSVQCRNSPSQRFHMLPDLLVLGLGFLVGLTHARQLQIRLQVSECSGDIVQLIGQEAAIAQLAQC